ncbi:MAG: sensor histidine kinase [Phocaeicola sp.]
MKPSLIKQRPLELAIHVISWLLIFGFPLIFLNRDNEQLSWIKLLKHTPVPLSCFFIFYANYLKLVPLYLFRERDRYFYLYNLLLIISVSVILQIGLDFMHHSPPPESMVKEMPPRWMFIFRDFIMLFFVAALGAAIRISTRWRKTEQQLIETEKARTEAELKNLKSQLNPHFLLNTLNNIYALITFNADKAQEAVQELSKLLRYVLYENQGQTVPLEKEFDFIKNYIALMRIRLPEHVVLDVQLTVDPGNSLRIAPLIFISLIENAFKHGISSTLPSFIFIYIRGREDGTVICHIQNTNFPKKHDDKSGSGIGLEQVERRLELLYHKKYTWVQQLSENGEKYHSLLTIQT